MRLQILFWMLFVAASHLFLLIGMAQEKNQAVKYARFSRDSKRIFLVIDEALHIVSVEKGDTLNKIPLIGSKQLFTDNESVLVDVSEGFIKVWDLNTYELRSTIWLPAVYNRDIKLSPQGDKLAVAEGSRNRFGEMTFSRIKIWNTQSGELINNIVKPDDWTGQGGLISIAFSPDGRHLASGSMFGRGDSVAGALKLWDAQTGELIRTFSQPTAGLANLTFSSDGQYIGAMRSRGMDDAHTRGPFFGLWNVQSGELLCNSRLRLDRDVQTQLITLPSGMLLLNAGKSKTILDPKSGLIMLNNFDVEAPDVLARWENLVLKRGLESLTLENTKTKKVVKEWLEFR